MCDDDKIQEYERWLEYRAAGEIAAKVDAAVEKQLQTDDVPKLQIVLMKVLLSQIGSSDEKLELSEEERSLLWSLFHELSEMMDGRASYALDAHLLGKIYGDGEMQAQQSSRSFRVLQWLTLQAVELLARTMSGAKARSTVSEWLNEGGLKRSAKTIQNWSYQANEIESDAFSRDVSLQVSETREAVTSGNVYSVEWVEGLLRERIQFYASQEAAFEPLRDAHSKAEPSRYNPKK